MTGRLRDSIAFFFGLFRDFLRDHFHALLQQFSLDCVENLLILLKRLLVVWPSFLSLVVGVLLLTLSQVADLLARPLDPLEVIVLILCLLTFWIIPLHLGARILLTARNAGLESSKQAPDKLDIWLPRDLGLLAILSITIAIATQARDYDVLVSQFTSDGLRTPDGALWIVPPTVLLSFLVYLGVRERTNQTLSEGAGRRLAVLFTVVSVAFVLAASLFPFQVAWLFGGLLFFPMLVGGWIMPVVCLIVLQQSSVPWRRAVQLGTVVVVLALIVGDASSDNPFHDLRMIADKTVIPQPQAQTKLEAYIEEWKTKNGCAAIEQGGGRCRAILVTAEGGASRAAFQVATVMGDLLDDPSLPGLRNKLFVFSGVSGGSLGLATVRQALADSTDGHPPCKADIGREGRHWIYYKTERAKEAATSWRKCLQLLVSGDYLTPAMVGLVLRDWWMAVPGNYGLHFDDRSALLERAMEQHYAAMTGKNCEAFEGLCAPFGHVDRSKSWLPALILNSTLVERGQNVVASDIDPSSPFPSETACRKQGGRVYPAHFAYPEALPTSYDIFELLDAREKTLAANTVKTIRDIRMSTAIVASARFPVISTRGNVRGPEKALVAQLVDGGYFDNSGLSSILDVIDALDCDKVESIVINIRNNPLDENSFRLWSFPGRTNIRQPALEIDDEKIDVTLSPIAALLNSREGHILDNRFSTINRVGFNSYIPANIYKTICLEASDEQGNCQKGRIEMRALSMSWWLSSYVQLFIELQDKDKLLDGKCGEQHCRQDAVGMLAGLLKPAQPTTTAGQVEPVTQRASEKFDPGKMGLDSKSLQRYAQ